MALAGMTNGKMCCFVLGTKGMFKGDWNGNLPFCFLVEI